MANIIQICFVLILCLGGTLAHMRFVCPRPESGDSGIKEGICSSENNPFELRYTDITPGPLTLQFEETVVHQGAPLRLTLNQYGKDEGCMLLDQVPHNEMAKMDISPSCWPFSFPIGLCPAQHFVTVMIPDIECDQCYLQLVSVMTDKYYDDELPCWQMNQAQNNCSSYFSCANVKIRPTKAGKGKGIDTCRDYNTNLRGVWPYRPQDYYQVKMSGEAGEATYDSKDSTLSVILPSSIVNSQESLIAKVVHVTERYEVSRGDVSSDGPKLTAVLTIPKENVKDLTENLMELVLETAADNIRVASGGISLLKKEFEMDYYGRHGIDYTPMGWLKGPEFVGQEATYPFALESYGSCMPKTTFYAGTAVLSGNKGAGVVQVTLSEYHGVVRGAFTGTVDISVITLSGNGVSDMDIPTSHIHGSTVYSMVNFKAAVDANTFYDTVMVTFSNNEEVTFALKEAVTAAMFDRQETYGGSAALTIGAFGQISYTLVVTGVDSVSSMSLNGPARRGLTGPVLVEMTPQLTADGAFATGTFEASAVELDSLWNALAYLDIRTDSTDGGYRGISGQLSIPTCSGPANTCFHSILSLSGGEIDRSVSELDSNGAATFRVTSQGTVEYRMTVRDTKPSEEVTDAILYGPWGYSYDLKATFAASELEDKVLVASGEISSPDSYLLQYLAAGNLDLYIYTSRYSSFYPIYGSLPAIRRPTN